jgi:hypothetical protein
VRVDEEAVVAVGTDDDEPRDPGPRTGAST